MREYFSSLVSLLYINLLMAQKKDTQKIRISVQAFDHRLLDEAVNKIVGIARDSGAMVVGPIPLPTKIQKITVNRSTFVNKDAREQFEIRRHKRLVEIQEPTSKTLEMLQSVSVPSGVGVEIKA